MKKIIFIFTTVLLTVATVITTESTGVEEVTEPISVTETTTELMTETTTTEPITETTTEPDVTFFLTDYERSIAECIVMGEAGAESYEGQVLVAQCLLNACIKDNMLPSEIRVKYQYSGWNTNITSSVRKAVRNVFDNGFELTNKPILYFYNPDICESSWHETQKYILTEGSHRFFAEV